MANSVDEGGKRHHRVDHDGLRVSTRSPLSEGLLERLPTLIGESLDPHLLIGREGPSAAPVPPLGEYCVSAGSSGCGTTDTSTSVRQRSSTGTGGVSRKSLSGVCQALEPNPRSSALSPTDPHQPGFAPDERPPPTTLASPFPSPRPRHRPGQARRACHSSVVSGELALPRRGQDGERTVTPSSSAASDRRSS